jgi:hypothetical protein
MPSGRWQEVRILTSVQTKVCVDGSLMKEYVLDTPLTEDFLKFLENFGTVRFLEQLKKPYFSFEKDLFISIKGFVGDNNVEVRYKKEFQDLVALLLRPGRPRYFNPERSGGLHPGKDEDPVETIAGK